jgi:hypothetical protein
MTESTERSDTRLNQLENQVRRLRLTVAMMLVILVGTGVAAFTQSQPDIVRARGIVIEDAAGRERILIGAPIPPANNRVRTDSIRARQAWAGRFPDPDEYMRYYADYRNSMHGMLVLDENGYDRVAIGDSTPDPNIGRRLGPSTGIQINDDHGFERSGYSLLKVNGSDRVVLGLDGRRGEGVVLSLDEGNQMGLSIYGPERTVGFFGSAIAGNSRTGVADSVFGLVLRRGDEVAHVLNVADRR